MFRYRLESCEVEGNRKVEVDGFLLKRPSVLFVYYIFFYVLFYTFLLFLFRERGESYFCFRLLLLYSYFLYCIYFISCIILFRDAPKWKFLAKAKPNKMKHWAEGRIPNMVFQKCSPPCRPILLFFSLLHKLNSQNQIFTLLSCFTKKKHLKTLLNTEHFYTSFQTYQQSTI